MSKSKKWKEEWDMFLDTDGRRKYNERCRRCSKSCKQSFRAKVMSCPSYSSKRAESEIYCSDKG